MWRHEKPLDEFETMILAFVRKHPGVGVTDIEDSVGVWGTRRVTDALDLLISKGLITFTLDGLTRYFPR